MNGHRCPSIPQGERLSVQFAKLFLRKLLGEDIEDYAEFARSKVLIYREYAKSLGIVRDSAW